MTKTKQKQTIKYHTLQERILNIKKERDKAFLTTTYATLARVGEITKHINNQKKNPPIKKEQIRQNQEKQKIYIDLITEKSQTPRTIPLSTKKRNQFNPKPWGEKWITDIILSWKKNCITEELFPFTTRWGEKIFEKHFPEFDQHIHLLRSWRASHLLSGQVTGNLLARQVVKVLGGWSSLSTMDRIYDQTIIEEYEHLL